jgi:hypothetical protein
LLRLDFRLLSDYENWTFLRLPTPGWDTLGSIETATSFAFGRQRPLFPHEMALLDVPQTNAGGPTLLGMPMKQVSLITVSWSCIQTVINRFSQPALTMAVSPPADLPELGPHPHHALLASNDPQWRSPILRFHGRVPHRGHQVGHLSDFCYIRGFEESSTFDPSYGAL